MSSRRGSSLLAALAVVLAGCAVADPVSGDTAQPFIATPAASGAVPVKADGVEPCTTLPTTKGERPPDSERLAELVLPCLTGGPPVNPAHFGGRPMVINLWATWCGPCRDEMPVLQDGHQRFGDQVSFVGVDTRDSPQAAAAFLEDIGVTYPQLVDVDGQLLASLGIPGLPVTVVLDTDGRVMNRHVGPLTADGLDDLVEMAVRSPHAGTKSSRASKSKSRGRGPS
jgi:cytochrome c biogenesis protein CcmG/thiol:disulfide interchange protein DsbE